MDSYEKRNNAYDRFFDRALDKLSRYEDKLDIDRHPEETLNLYEELTQKAYNLYQECLSREYIDDCLFPHSDEAHEQWLEYQDKKADFLSRYDEALEEWKEIEAEKKERRKRKKRKSKKPSAARISAKRDETPPKKEYGISIQIYMHALYARLTHVLRIACAQKLIESSAYTGTK